MPDSKKRHSAKAMRVARDAMLTMFTPDEIARAAIRLVPDAHGEIAKLDSAPERAALLVQIAQREDLLDDLLDLIFKTNTGLVDP